MLENTRISQMALDVARTQSLNDALERILVDEMIDSYGQEALNVLVVLKPDGLDAFLDDGKALDFLSGVNDELQAAGDQRFAFVRYATEAELAEADEDEDDL